MQGISSENWSSLTLQNKMSSFFLYFFLIKKTGAVYREKITYFMQGFAQSGM